MLRRGTKQGAWRRSIGWLAAYALVLQLLLGAFAGAQFSAEAAGQNWSFLEICYGKRAADSELPGGAPSKQASKAFGCAVCAAAAVALAPEPPSSVQTERVVTDVTWTVGDVDLVPSPGRFSQRQRAPPSEA